MIDIDQRWEGETVAVIACGPSVKEYDVNRLKGHARVIVVNDSHRLCPWADMLYAADQRWWQHYEYVSGFRGERWTQQRGTIDWPQEAEDNGLSVIESTEARGLSFDPKRIHTGMNSGFQALNLATLQGAARVLLLGVDLAVIGGHRHWFGNHPGRMNRDSPYNMFRQAFDGAAPQLAQLGIEVVNCSPTSTLGCFPKMTVTEALA